MHVETITVKVYRAKSERKKRMTRWSAYRHEAILAIQRAMLKRMESGRVPVPSLPYVIDSEGQPAHLPPDSAFAYAAVGEYFHSQQDIDEVEPGFDADRWNKTVSRLARMMMAADRAALESS
jgi:hypothetical protein